MYIRITPGASLTERSSLYQPKSLGKFEVETDHPYLALTCSRVFASRSTSRESVGLIVSDRQTISHRAVVQSKVQVPACVGRGENWVPSLPAFN